MPSRFRPSLSSRTTACTTAPLLQTRTPSVAQVPSKGKGSFHGFATVSRASHHPSWPPLARPLGADPKKGNPSRMMPDNFCSTTQPTDTSASSSLPSQAIGTISSEEETGGSRTLRAAHWQLPHPTTPAPSSPRIITPVRKVHRRQRTRNLGRHAEALAKEYLLVPTRCLPPAVSVSLSRAPSLRRAPPERHTPGGRLFDRLGQPL